MNSKNIIITGTSRGIGLALVQYFVNQNHQVLAVSRNTEIFDELRKEYSNLSVLEAEITNQEEIKEISKFVSKNWTQVDVLVHNAGKLIHKPFLQTSQKDFMDVYNVNVFAVANLTKAIIPFLNKGSHVVAISSIGGIQGSLKFAGLSAYSSSKGALITLMELLAEDGNEMAGRQTNSALSVNQQPQHLR